MLEGMDSSFPAWQRIVELPHLSGILLEPQFLFLPCQASPSLKRGQSTDRLLGKERREGEGISHSKRVTDGAETQGASHMSAGNGRDL